MPNPPEAIVPPPSHASVAFVAAAPLNPLIAAPVPAVPIPVASPTAPKAPPIPLAIPFTVAPSILPTPTRLSISFPM